jgi:1-acyl-sn-glycerol-3-phosphate acyltransferase
VNRLEADAASPRGPGSSPATPSQLLAVITAMLSELRGGEVPLVTLDDHLESRLGIDSLARMELMLRLEKAFAVRMPEPMVEQAQTPRDLLRALAAASPRQREEFGPLGAAEPVPSAPDGLALPHRAGTLIEVLQWHADRSGDRVHVSFLGDGDAPLQRLTHAVLLERAQKVAAGLQRAGLAPGESVALMLPTSLGFFEAFAGILLAGGVPIPIYPPFRASQIEDHLRRQAHILDNGRAVLLISDERARLSASILRAGVPALRSVFTIDRLLELGGTWHPGRTSAQDTALLQYTSGSTGQPKGVVLTHANLLANIRVMGQALKATPGDVFVSWLPLYHDMGLIGAWMGSLYHGVPLFVMPPQAFLARPSRWLQALHRHRGTLSAAPNFAYEILATKVLDDELEGLDLSAWRVAANGAEPVHAATLTRFAERFRPYGFDPRSMMPMYGLAESGVGLAFPPLGRGPRIDCIDRRVLNAEGRAEPVSAAQAPSGMQVVCCGQPLAGHEIRVVDVRGAEVPERREGRIEFRGPSASAGYFHNADATRALFRDDWLDTGDVGYVAEGEIYLTSRVKDLIIRGGHNIHPYDLEEAVGNLQGVRQGCVAVFGAADPMSSTDRVVVLAETRTKDPGLRAGLRERIGALSIALLGVPADEIVLAEPRTVLKTSSGKIRRAACRTLYEQGRLRAANRSVGWQVARLELDAIARRLREPLQRALNALYAGWAWTLFGLGAAVAAPIALLPTRGVRKRAARAVARLVVQTSMLPLHVQGADRLEARPAVVVVNHASYVDWLVLTAVLPPEMSFVAKSDLARFRPLRWVLSRMGTRFVERDDVHASVEDARALLRAVQGGESLVFFPEGTLTRAPGLGGFQMGAFVAAADAGVALVPVSLRGTRSVLRDGSWWPHRHPVEIHVHAPLHARAHGWREALELRNAARERIAATCGEPLLSTALRS